LHGQLAQTFALRSPKAIYLLPGEHGEILGETIGGVGTSGMLEHKSGNRPISETREDTRKVTMHGVLIGTRQRSFERYHSRPPTASSSVCRKIGSLQLPPKISLSIISGMGKASDLKFGLKIWPIHS